MKAGNKTDEEWKDGTLGGWKREEIVQYEDEKRMKVEEEELQKKKYEKRKQIEKEWKDECLEAERVG